MGGQREPEDLTTRARIRDAAMLEFARLGEKGATIRGIAKAAGVSPALVQHHFTNKAALRRACDTYAIDAIRRVKEEALSGGMENPNFLAIAMQTALPVQHYVARALAEDSDAARALFEDAVQFSEDILSRGTPGMRKPTTDDLHAYAAVITAMNFGIVVLNGHLSRALGTDILTPEGYPRLAMALMDIHTDNLITPELEEQTRAVLRTMLENKENR
ncbi:TetR/AcrR family transcriptional regulator [Actinomadura rifamycini]|uniref:TetR/AcrR family transcriptional regulator n=1 Tax=Actinomadura rifamycini TaxID=31962 RepID=UPI0003F86611|nr:TetR/AcrR family transcriptional regulator [Actinomadura rifamycini]